jgi:hypothetical protein
MMTYIIIEATLVLTANGMSELPIRIVTHVVLSFTAILRRF